MRGVLGSRSLKKNSGGPGAFAQFSSVDSEEIEVFRFIELSKFFIYGLGSTAGGRILGGELKWVPLDRCTGPVLSPRLVGYADSVLERGGGVRVYRDLELGGEGCGFGEFVGGGEHFPGAPYGLVYFYRDGGVFMVAEGQFEFHLIDVVGNFLKVGLFALGDDVESVAAVDGDGFIFGSVGDVVFADEEGAAFRILLVDTDVARG